MSARCCALLAGIAVAMCVAAPAASANGGDFFEELSSNWHTADPDAGQPYFGFVKDNKGRAIIGAAVSATTANGSTFVVQTDNQGHYRVPGFTKTVDPKKVTISCAKTGYKLMARDRRMLRTNPNAPVEVNCVMAPENVPARATS
jgi:hypothetical protein